MIWQVVRKQNLLILQSPDGPPVPCTGPCFERAEAATAPPLHEREADLCVRAGPPFPEARRQVQVDVERSLVLRVK